MWFDSGSPFGLRMVLLPAIGAGVCLRGNRWDLWGGNQCPAQVLVTDFNYRHWLVSVAIVPDTGQPVQPTTESAARPIRRTRKGHVTTRFPPRQVGDDWSHSTHWSSR